MNKEKLKGYLDKVKGALGKVSKKIWILLAVVLVVAVAAVVLLYNNRPYAVLIDGANNEETSTVISWLGEQGVTDFRMEGTGTILVPQAQAAGLKAKLLQEQYSQNKSSFSGYFERVGALSTQYDRRVAELEALEEKLESLQSLLEEKLSPQPDPKQELPKEPPMDENFKFIKMIYGILLENEVEEKYVNQIMDEVEKVMKGGASLDLILSSIYQKMILKFGQPQPIELADAKPKVVFFIGPTGVGKTTTIAKIASQFKLDRGKKVALFTADTYRIAAVEQLRTYANILDTELNIIYSSKELNEKLRETGDYDLVLVDTAGFSHKNQEQLAETRELVRKVPDGYDKEAYLVLSATTKYRDLLDIADVYKENFTFKMIFTKMDETSSYGNILNMRMYTGAELSYSTYGQNVPEDIEIFNTQKIVKLLLGGK